MTFVWFDQQISIVRAGPRWAPGRCPERGQGRGRGPRAWGTRDWATPGTGLTPHFAPPTAPGGTALRFKPSSPPYPRTLQSCPPKPRRPPERPPQVKGRPGDEEGPGGGKPSAEPASGSAAQLYFRETWKGEPGPQNRVTLQLPERTGAEGKAA